MILKFKNENYVVCVVSQMFLSAMIENYGKKIWRSEKESKKQNKVVKIIF